MLVDRCSIDTVHIFQKDLAALRCQFSVLTAYAGIMTSISVHINLWIYAAYRVLPSNDNHRFSRWESYSCICALHHESPGHQRWLILLFKLRFQLATGQLENSARIARTKRDIARALTELRDREIQAAEATQGGES